VKRVWLLLLVWVLSVQTSWAAVHFCDEAARASHTPASHQHADLFPQTDEHGGTGDAGLPDACCSVAHAYHGLQSLISQDATELALLPASTLRIEARQPVARDRFAERHERPQWPPA
jgi:hypothetical protein